MRPLLYFIVIWIGLSTIGQAQPIAGQQLFPFLNLPTHARVAALGGQVASATQPDGMYFQNNPALADSMGDHQLGLSFMPYLAAAKYYTLHYGLPFGHNAGQTGRWAAGLQYLSYGQFDLTDPSGNNLGTFTANDYALSLSHARTEGNYSLGATIKAVGSAIELYSAFAVMADLGGVWRHPKKQLTFGLTAKNIGRVLRNYSPTDARLPFDLQAGVTFKPAHAPVRITVTAHHLHRFDIAYNDPALNRTYDLNGNPIVNKVGLADKLARHLIVGAELLISRNLNVLVGYNHQRRQEGRLQDFGGLSGLSFGLSAQARGFQLTYARFMYTPAAGGSSQLSLRISMDRILTKN
ncbi:type IX secretion system protein PorQ [Arsenicibacter rosenii]|uniref:type IX secretion system protein PorQ n=1 Tax=Arsenicibacter rosenii TaxID=1750698 RepID=UPI000AF57B20|nr:type IX secretion system protein PorQ [Arsenicibacter rosenii]